MVAIRGIAKTVDLRDELLDNVQHMIHVQAVKRIGKVQFDQHVICSHVLDEPPSGVYSCPATSRYPHSDLDWTEEFGELGGGVCACTFDSLSSLDIAHDDMTDTSRLFIERDETSAVEDALIFGVTLPLQENVCERCDC